MLSFSDEDYQLQSQTTSQVSPKPQLQKSPFVTRSFCRFAIVGRRWLGKRSLKYQSDQYRRD